jgi:hypothetical protein
MLRVAAGGQSSSITKQGEDFLATEALPDVPMTFVGSGLFSYRVEV